MVEKFFPVTEVLYAERHLNLPLTDAFGERTANWPLPLLLLLTPLLAGLVVL